jgi:hypothetical protein
MAGSNVGVVSVVVVQVVRGQPAAGSTASVVALYTSTRSLLLEDVGVAGERGYAATT